MAETYTARSIACAGKVPFRSRELALVAAGRKDVRTPYRCPYCQAWHVGNDERSAHSKRPFHRVRGRFAREELEP